MRQSQLAGRLTFLVAIFAVLFLVFGFTTWRTLEQVRVKGPIYGEIIRGEHLIADVLPPPAYIIESYLLVLQAADEPDAARVEKLIERGERLRLDYEARQEFWRRDLPEGELKDYMTVAAAKSAMQFFRIRDEQFVPALRAGDRERASALIPTMHRHYEAHRLAIDEVVARSLERNHEAGDAVLVETARRLQACLLADDLAMRWGGEEFLVIGRDHTPASAKSLAKRLLQVVGGEPHVLPSGQSIQVTCSLGYAPLHWQTGDGDALLSREQIINLADQALYLSKLEGRNRAIGVYPGEDSSFTRRMTQLATQPGGLRDEHGKGVRLQAVAGPAAGTAG